MVSQGFDQLAIWSRVKAIISDRRGLTLAEVLIAILLIGGGLVGMMWVLPFSTGYIQQSKRKTTAAFLAQQRLEQLKNAKWTTSPAVDCVGFSPTPYPPQSAPTTGSWTGCPAPVPASLPAVTFADEAYNTIAGYSAYRRTVRIIDCSALPGCGNPAVVSANLRQVTVSVFFNPMTGSGSFNLTAEDGAQVTTMIAKQ